MMMHKAFLEMKAVEHKQKKLSMGQALVDSMFRAPMVTNIGHNHYARLRYESDLRKEAIREVKRADAVQVELNRLTR